MKNVLLLTHDDSGQDACLEAALEVVKAVDGHLDCANVGEPARPFVGAGRSVLRRAPLGGQERAGVLRERWMEQLSHEDVRWSWTETSDSPLKRLSEAARRADLIVLGSVLPAPSDMQPLVCDVVLRSGRPVLAVPPRSRSKRVCGARVMLAWDGSDEAICAMLSSIDLLRLASHVRIVEIDDGSVRTPAEDAVNYLSRYGIKSDVLRNDPDIDVVIPMLIGGARVIGADYIVMGGFSEWRLVETLLCGKPHWMISECPAPLLITH